MTRGGAREGSGRKALGSGDGRYITLWLPSEVEAELVGALRDEEKLTPFIRDAALKEARRRKT